MAQFSNSFIHGSTINLAQGNININNSEQGLHALSQAVSHGAIHDSAERHPAPNCHPDTRKAVRQIIIDWIHNERLASIFFWLYGSAGAGKTAILQAIAEFLCSSSESPENFGGSFFFSRGKSDRDQGHFLFLTIAYQLALKVPGLREHVNDIMEANPTLPTKSMVVQLQSLIVDSFRRLSPLPQRSYIVIIDGLDECRDKATQQSILQLLCSASTDHQLPLRFIIGSRQEFQIRTIFDQESFYKITQRVVLDEKFNPGRDIQVFLQDGFATICVKNADIMSHVKQPWPGRGVIDLLVQRSSGQFIYASTVLNFVATDSCNPTTQLALILKPDSTAFSDLDQLYNQILSVHPTIAGNIVQVLGIIEVFDARTLTPEVIGDILEMERGDVMLVLRCLSSLIAFVGDGDQRYRVGSVYFTHASFRDYLEDPSRSGAFHINISEYRKWATIQCFSLIFRTIGRSWRIPPNLIPHSETWGYFKKYLAGYLISPTTLVTDAIMTEIHDLVQEFWTISRGGVVTVDVSFTAMCCLMDILQDDNPTFKLTSEHRIITDEFQKMFDHSLSKSKEWGDLLMFLPGIVVQQPLTVQAMADLYGVEMAVLERLMESTIQPIVRQSHVSFSRYTLAPYLSRFLQDRDRSQRSYCDPVLHHIYICRHFVFLLDGSNASDLQSNELPEYAYYSLYEHLCFATEILLSRHNISGDHPVIEIIKDLERSTYDSLDPRRQPPGYRRLAQCVIRAVLRWADTLKDAAVSIPNDDLIKRAYQVTDKIYRGTLCIKMDQHTRIVALIGLAPSPNLRKAAQHWTVIQISWELLEVVSVDNRILCSFTDFITTPEISGPFYISPDVYHTQITEYSLETLYGHNNNRASPFNLDRDRVLRLNCCFQDHISRALPTEMIFYILRSLVSSSSWGLGLHEVVDILGIIIKWLEGLGSERPTDLYDRCRIELEEKQRRGPFPYKREMV